MRNFNKYWNEELEWEILVWEWGYTIDNYNHYLNT